MKGFTFLGTIYLARVLGIAGFGKFSLAIAVGTYLWTIADMGVTGYGTREIARNKENAEELLRILNSLRLVVAIISFLFLVLILFLMNIPLETRLVLIAGGLYVVTYSLSPDWVLRGIERMEYIALGNAAIAIAFLGSVFLFIKTPADLIDAVIFRSLSFLIGSIVLLIILKKKIKIGFAIKLSPSKWRLHIRESFYFAVNGGLSNLGNFIPLFFLGIMATSEEIGLFSAPHRLIMLLVGSIFIISRATYPIFSSLYVTDKDKFKMAHNTFQKIVLYIGLPIGIMGMVISKDIIKFLFGDNYLSGGNILAVMIWLIPLRLLRTNYGRSLLSAGFQRFNIFATGSGVITAVLLCIFLIPEYGGQGAAIAMLGGEILTLFVMGLMFMAKLYQSNPFDFYFLKVITAGITAGVIMKIMHLSFVYSSIMGVLIYGSVSILIGVISIEGIKETYRKILIPKIQITAK